jgi:hypothetical protein
VEGARVTTRHLTVCIDFESGIQLATYPDKMIQVQVEADFYVGQRRYRVVDKLDGNDEEPLVLVLKKHEEP